MNSEELIKKGIQCHLQQEIWCFWWDTTWVTKKDLTKAELKVDKKEYKSVQLKADTMVDHLRNMKAGCLDEKMVPWKDDMKDYLLDKRTNKKIDE
jgi:hypothetical protein